MLWGCSPPLRPTCWARENTLLSVVRWISLYLPFTFTSIIIHFKFRGHFYFFDLNDMGNWCSKSYLPSSMMQSKQNRFWKGKGMVGPAHSRLRTVTLNNASHHHLTVQTVVWCFTSSSYSADWTPSPPCQHPWASSRCLLGAPKLERTPRDLLPQVQLFPLSLADPSSQTEHTLLVRVRVRVSVTNVIHVTHVWNYSWQKFKQQYEVVGWVW